MKILFVSSEITPFAATGGLAEVVGSLPRVLKRLGHDVRLVMPCYKMVGRSGAPIRKGRKGVDVVMNGVPHKGLLRQTQLDDLPVYFLENREFFHRDGLYGTPAGDFPDNHLRFSFFCRGVLELLRRLDFRPDVIHCHDWQTALIPYLLRHYHREDPFFMGTATVFTIHNLAYQGVFPHDVLAEMGLGPRDFAIDRLEFYGRVNLLKGGLGAADILTTVSPTYCHEILTPEQGCGLEGVLRERRDDLFGILNGLDEEQWSPASDRELFRPYTASTLAGKLANKKGLQKALDLADNPDLPLVGMVGRLATQKGIDLLVEILPWLSEQGLQMVLLGAGDEVYIRRLQAHAARTPGTFALRIGFDPALSHRIYAGADLFLMPSHYEPCGLGQLIALRYGTVPVVHKTGGLADTVFDVRLHGREGNGFVFEEYTPEALREALQAALEAYRDRDSWKKLIRRGMQSDFSWERAAVAYEELYRRAVATKRL